jgi:hypothetical protein
VDVLNDEGEGRGWGKRGGVGEGGGGFCIAKS